MLDNEETLVAWAEGRIKLKEAQRLIKEERATDGRGLMVGGVFSIQHGQEAPKIFMLGSRDWANTEPVAPTDSFRIYSVTKSIVGKIVEELVANGALRLDEKLTDVISDMKNKGIEKNNCFDSFLGINPEAAIQDLLMHRAGIGEYNAAGPFMNTIRGRMRDCQNGTGRTTSYLTLEEIFSNTSPVQPENDGIFNYSNAGYQLLALIAAHKTDQSFQSLVEQYCSRIGLYSTQFPDAAKNAADQGHIYIAQGYGVVGDGLSPSTISQEEFFSENIVSSKFSDLGGSSDPCFLGGAGALFSTIDDMHKWARYLHDRPLPENSTIPMGNSKGPTRVDKNGHYGHGIMLQHVGGVNLVGHGGFGLGGRTTVNAYKREDGTVTSIVSLQTWENVTIEIAKQLLQKTPGYNTKDTDQQERALRAATLAIRDYYTEQETGKYDRNRMLNEFQDNRFPYHAIREMANKVMPSEIRVGH